MPAGFRVYTAIARPDSGLLERFASVHSADLCDAMNKAGAVSGAIRPMYAPMRKVVGSAVTISVPTGALNVIKEGMQQTRRGDVLVINGYCNTAYAFIGGNLCRGLLKRGLAGIIIDGAARDISEIAADGLPIYARGVATGSGPVDGPGEINVPIACGSVVVNPGDIIVADADGIMVVPPADAEEALRGVAKLKALHGPLQDILQRGEVTNIAAIERKLREQGCEFLPRAG
jgi:regulator of RNase E activity RraA